MHNVSVKLSPPIPLRKNHGTLTVNASSALRQWPKQVLLPPVIKTSHSRCVPGVPGSTGARTDCQVLIVIGVTGFSESTGGGFAGSAAGAYAGAAADGTFVGR